MISKNGNNVFSSGLPILSRAVKRCSCKRSQCLKMYCDCFAAGGYCGPGCGCVGCSNTLASNGAVFEARSAILAKDSTAFEAKVLRGEGHKKGCRCKRSKCLKKYCECYNAGAKCNPAVCQCDGCENWCVTLVGYTNVESGFFLC